MYDFKRTILHLGLFYPLLNIPCMKTTLAFIFLSLFYFSIKAQTVVVEADKMNVFYLGVDNPIAIAIEGVADEKLKVTIDNGEIIKKERGHYMARLEKTGTANIIVEWDNQKVLKLFRVKQIPDPRVVIGSRDRNFYVYGFNGLITILDNFDFDAQCRVVSYTCTCNYKNEDSKQAQVTGKISSEVTQLLNNLKKGDKVTFSDIKVTCPGDKVPRFIKDNIVQIIE